MHNSSKIALLAMACLLITTSSSVNSTNSIEMPLLGKREIPAKIYNPLPSRDRVMFGLKASGDITAWYTDHPMEAEFSQVIGAKQNVSKYITIMPTSCWEKDCEGRIKATVNSQETGLNNSKEVNVTITRDKKGVLRSAPGLEFVHLLLIGIVGTLATGIASRRQ